MWREPRSPRSGTYAGNKGEAGNEHEDSHHHRGKSVNATLADNETSKDFASLLPLTLTLKDYADTEKISDLPRKLSTKGAPPGFDPSVGDITYYAPWGNLALFHRDFGYSSGLIKIGTIDAGAEVLRQPGALKATFERITD